MVRVLWLRVANSDETFLAGADAVGDANGPRTEVDVLPVEGDCSEGRVSIVNCHATRQRATMGLAGSEMACNTAATSKVILSRRRGAGIWTSSKSSTGLHVRRPRADLSDTDSATEPMADVK